MLFNNTKLSRYWLPFILPAALVLVWAILSANGRVNPILLPKPEQVVGSLVQMLGNGELVNHIQASLLRILPGFLIGSVLGVGFGVVTGFFGTTRQLIGAPLRFLRAIPIYAWIPMLILWFGIGETSKIVAISMGVFFPVHLNTEDGIRNTDRRFMEIAYLLQLTRIETIRKIILPGAMPFIYSGLRQGLSRAFMVVVVAELIAATSGLGYLISDARLLFRPDVMIVSIIAIGIVGILFDHLIGLAEKRSLRWSARLGG